MRIAIFTDTYLPDKNGVSTSIDNFTKLLAEEGHQIMIFCPKNGLFSDKKHANITTKRYISFTAPTYKDMQIALPFILTVIKDLKEFNPDIVHVQTPIGIGWIGIWASKILKIKNIQTYHTYIPDFLVYFKPKTLFGIDRMANSVNSSRLIKALVETDVSEGVYNAAKLKVYLGKKIKDVTEKVSSNKTSKYTDKFGRNLTRAIYNRADLVLTPSNSMKKIIKKQGIKPKIEVLSNGIDYELFKKKTDYAIKNKIIHMGRLGYEKNIDVIIRAFGIAVITRPELKLDIMGDGPARKSLHLLVKNLGLTKQIRFTGAYDIKKVSQQLCDYDFFITASTIETQGLVIIESMAAGLPVIGVDKFAVPEVVLDGKNGYISQPFDVEAMANNILHLLSSDRKLEEFGHRSLKIAKTHELAVCKERLLHFYEKVAKS